jgi:hypothetical protein
MSNREALGHQKKEKEKKIDCYSSFRKLFMTPGKHVILVDADFFLKAIGPAFH